MSATVWSNVSDVVERNKTDREPRHDLSSWADCRESRPSPTPTWRMIPCPAAVRFHWCRVLSVFILSLLDCIRPSISSMHSENWRAATDDSETGTLRCTCVSSAYECATSPFLLMTSNSSAVYSRKRRGPRTKPCGTPKSSRPMDDSRPIYSTCWVRPTRNVLIHSSTPPPTPNLIRRSVWYSGICSEKCVCQTHSMHQIMRAIFLDII